MNQRSCKALVIGAGPGGYVAAIRAGQLGLDTIVVEAERPGGTCLNIGCIPSKALIHAAEEFEAAKHRAQTNALGISASAPTIDLARTIAWKDGIVQRLTGGVSGLLRKAKVTTIHGTAKFRDGRTVEVTTAAGVEIIKPEHTIIATGSAAVELPFLPFGGKVMSSTEALALTEVPRSLVVVGGGYIGIELGTAFAKFGAQVTIVEAAGKILPQYDSELTRPVAARLAHLGVEVMTGTKAKGLSPDGAGLVVTQADGTELTLPADKILVTVGRRPRADGLGLEAMGVTMERGAIRIDERCRTSMRGLYAIGDVTGEPMLAHRAMAQGEMVADIIAGENRVWDKIAIPAVCFTDPEIVSVGLSPDEAKAAGHDVVFGHFPFQANGRAMSVEREDGFVRIVARKSDHLVLGVQAVGAGVSELSSGFALALEMGARLEDIAGTIHTHPTRGEVVQEAALKALGRALHI